MWHGGHKALLRSANRQWEATRALQPRGALRREPRSHLGASLTARCCAVSLRFRFLARATHFVSGCHLSSHIGFVVRGAAASRPSLRPRRVGGKQVFRRWDVCGGAAAARAWEHAVGLWFARDVLGAQPAKCMDVPCGTYLGLLARDRGTRLDMFECFPTGFDRGLELLGPAFRLEPPCEALTTKRMEHAQCT